MSPTLNSSHLPRLTGCSLATSKPGQNQRHCGRPTPLSQLSFCSHSFSSPFVSLCSCDSLPHRLKSKPKKTLSICSNLVNYTRNIPEQPSSKPSCLKVDSTSRASRFYYQLSSKSGSSKNQVLTRASRFYYQPTSNTPPGVTDIPCSCLDFSLTKIKYPPVKIPSQANRIIKAPPRASPRESPGIRLVPR